MSFEEGDLYAWNDLWLDERLKEEVIEMDHEILDMSIKEISNLLGEQYEKNVKDGFPVSGLIIKGFNVQTGKKMMMQIVLSEDIEEMEVLTK
ncbi:MAG: hypothetical protein K6A34_06300 [Methanobrevibacter sp.]|nr:hypothetical protein [Methanobrevibacter sp.]